ncbi:hypothetical protein E2542_SST01661 [Spatholobus suberectus]|nr:hypothetical protein E2542_SST01661 [Spatholobus suberectus]
MLVKMRTTCTWTERPFEALLFPEIGFRLFLCSLGGGQRRPPSGGLEPSMRYHSKRARILTMCQDLWAKGQSQASLACKGFLGPDKDWPSSAKAKGSLIARPTSRAKTKVGLSDSTVPSGRPMGHELLFLEKKQ